MDDIDKLGLIKFDALGLRTLDVLSDWKAAMARHDIEIEWSGLEWEDHDDEMWELLHKKYSAGIFQLEAGYASKLSEQLHPMSVADLSMIGALNRPGPIRSGAPDSFIARRRGDEEIRYDDPFLTDLLDTTYGWFLYQEQVIRFFGKLGYDESDADAVRKILGKKQPEKWAALWDGTDEWEGKSYVEMCTKARISEKNYKIIWAKLVDFGKYSFNKSHSVAYGTIGFRALFAKYNAPAEFYMACIRNVDKNKKAERIPAFVNEARRWGIVVHGPDIERSNVKTEVHNGDIYIGFDDIKKVSTEAAKYLVEIRDSGIDLSTPEKLNEYKEALSKQWSDENKRRKKENQPKLEGKSPGQRLNAGHIEHMYTAGVWERLEGFPTPLREMQERQKEMLSVVLADNVAEAFANNLEEVAECDTYEEAKAPYTEDMKFKLPGVITNVVMTEVKRGPNKGQSMGIVTIEYEGESLEFAVFHNKWTSTQFLWHERTPGIFVIRHAKNKKTGQTGYNLEEGFRLA
jgi:DNA polymerase-3 subunit alpha